MKNPVIFFKSFRVKVTLALILSMLLVSALSNFLIYDFALKSQFNQLRGKLSMVAQTAALLIDSDLLLRVPLNREGVNSPEYKIVIEQLKKIKAVNPLIKYIYTMRKTKQEGILEFVVDADPVVVNVKKEKLTSYPGDKYDATRFPQMLKAFDYLTTDKKLEVDDWGVTLSGYAPIRDKNNQAVALLGIDMTANDVYRVQNLVHRRALFVLAWGIIISLLVGMFVSKRITGPVKKLVEATRRISKGDLGHRVEVKGSDEIKELATSFNQMAISLVDAKKKVLDYFYDVVQSMVRILEAKDHYTRGHSERVSEYATRIAVRMGLPEDKIGLLSEMALLHDIGKLSIQDSILNKKGKLTEEEWEVVKKHPVIGEDILRPVILNEEMLLMVRGHHESYDGRGYPDKLGGENINIFAAIMCVADAFDAMTSERAYRPALSLEKAVRELKANKGIQFNPKVVEVFLSILEDDKNQPENKHS